jgi:hypothetical protein
MSYAHFISSFEQGLDSGVYLKEKTSIKEL